MNGQRLLSFLALIFLLALPAVAQQVDYRALGTNAFFTNSLIVNSKHWTNDNNAYLHQPGRSVNPSGAQGPPFFIRRDGSYFLGTNVTRDVTVSDFTHIHAPYVVSMSDSNEPVRVDAYWAAINSEGYDFFSSSTLNLFNDGTAPTGYYILDSKSSFGLESYVELHTDPTSATSSAIKVKRNGNTTFTTQQNGETHINAIDNDWLFKGQTNGDNTIQVRADGATFIGKNVAQDTSINDFTVNYFPYYFSLIDSNEPTTLQGYWSVINNENYNYYSDIHLKVTGDKDTPEAFWSMEAIGTNASRSQTFTIHMTPASPGTPLIDATFAGSSVITVGSDGDLDKIKSVAYSWPTAYGGANSVLTMPAADGSLVWSNIPALVTNNQARIGPGTNNFIAKFNVVGGTNVGNSPLYSADTNYVWQRQAAATGATYTNSATNVIFSIETSNANTNGRLEFVAGNPFANEASHVRYASKLAASRTPLYINDAWSFEPADTALGGHAAGYLYPLVTDLGGASGTGYGIGNSSLNVKWIYVNQVVSVKRDDGPLYGDGVRGVGLYTSGVLFLNSLSGPNQIQFNKNQQSSPCLDVGGSYIAFGIGQSNSPSYLGGDGQILSQLGSAYYGLVQVGTNNTSVAAPQPAGFIGAPSTGTDKGGTDLKLIGGPSTGTGTNGNVRIQTSEKANSTSSSINATQKDRIFVIADPIILTTNSATIVANITIPTALRGVGGQVIAHTEIENGVDIATTDEIFTFTANRKGSTVVTGISAPVTCTSTSGGSAAIANTWTAVANSTSVDLKLTCVTSGILSTNSTVRVTIIPNSSAVPVITHP